MIATAREPEQASALRELSVRVERLDVSDAGSVSEFARRLKAALNMFVRTLAQELRPEGFICVLLDPGWVKTNMGGPGAPTPPEQSVRGMLKVMDGLSRSETGRFFSSRGKEVRW